jgi:hypothetical protein
MLNAHPLICMPPETHFFRQFIANGRFNRIYSEGGSDNIEKVLNTDGYLQRIDKEILKQALTNTFKAVMPDGRGLFVNLLDAYASQYGKPIWGDKDPKCVEYVPSLKAHFPNAYILHVIRDPRDVLVSRMKASWSEKRSVLNHVFAYKVQLHFGRRMGRRLFKDRYNEIVYEDLLNNPRKTLEHLCMKLGLNFSEYMLAFNKSSREIVSDDELAWKKNVLNPLLKNNQKKWVSRLTKPQIALVEKVCREVFTDPGYIESHSYQTLSPIERGKINTADVLLHLASFFYFVWKINQNRA